MAIVVFSTEPETVLSLADRVLVMRKGEIAHEFAERGDQQGSPAGGGLTTGHSGLMDTPDAKPKRRPPVRFRPAFLRDQLRNIAPFITLLFLVVFFSIASPSFATLDNLENILQQVSVTAIIAVGLTFVILTAEIDLSVAAVANATAIVLTFFTLQPDYVNIANLPLPGAARHRPRADGLRRARPDHRLRRHRIGIPSFIMTLAMMQIGAGISAVLVRGQIAYSVPR